METALKKEGSNSASQLYYLHILHFAELKIETTPTNQ